jgi:nucleotide-binding universal stress UspA family protein
MPDLQSILVPINESSASLDAIGIACSLAKRQKGRVYVAHVIEVARSLPLNAGMDTEARRGEQLLRRAEEIAAANDYHVEAELLQAREAGQAIVEEAGARGVKAIIMGIGYSRLHGAFQVGRTAGYVLKHAHCQVWVVRQAVTE